jgi:hypothetical protein
MELRGKDADCEMKKPAKVLWRQGRESGREGGGRWDGGRGGGGNWLFGAFGRRRQVCKFKTWNEK